MNENSEVEEAQASNQGERREPAPAGQVDRPGLLVAVAGVSCLTVTLLQSLVVPAIPQFPEILGATPTAVSWSVTATLLSGAVATPIVGALADRLPRKQVMAVTMAVVLVGSLIAPLGGIGMLIAGRTLQGMGTALIPVAMAEMRHSLSGQRLSQALALLSAMLGIGGGVGIPLGGVLIENFGWRSMFYFAAVASALCMALILWAVPSASAAPARGSFDFPGAILLALGLCATLTAISQGNEWGWGSALTIGLLIGGAAVLVGWAFVELRRQNPLVNLRTTAQRPVLLTNAASILLGTLMFTNLLLTTLELQNPVDQGGFGWATAAAGLAMLPSAAVMLVTAPISARLASSFGPRIVLVAGSAITTAGYLLRLVAAPHPAVLIVWATVVSLGVGIGYAGLPMMLVKHAPVEEMGQANAVNALMRSIGMALASAMVAAVSASLAIEDVPTAGALALLAGIGIAMGVVSTALSYAARSGKE